MRALIVVSAAVCFASAWACAGEPGPARDARPSTSASDWFVDGAQAAGLDVVHVNGMSGERYYPEMFGPGVGLIDVDNDGDLDVYVVQGTALGSAGAALAPRVSSPPPGDRLFRNDLVVHPDGSRTVRFTDVTAQSGIAIRTYGMGIAAGDIDNDGWVDLYRTGIDGSVMLRNQGNGTFVDVTRDARTSNAGAWGVSASFVDYDRDGWLDLYVGNYVDWTPETDVDCVGLAGQADYCAPNKYAAERDRLFRNRGGGTFEDVTARALAGGADGPALGVSTADVDDDGWMDVYVGNDGQPNQLWMNRRDGTFTDAAFASGAAVSGQGASEASMGVDAGDFDNDGDEDLFVTNWVSQMNTLYVNVGRGVFEDRKAASGLGAPSIARTGFGTAWLDADNDGWLDLLTVNGGVSAIEAQARAGDPFPFRMPKQLYRNLGDGRFADLSGEAGAALGVAEVSRGAAFGDVDNDGDTDVVVGNDAGPVRLLLNTIGSRQHWVGLRLLTAARRDALGAVVTVIRDDGMRLRRRARSDGSYASANDPRVLAGLGASTRPPRVRVRWPDGRSEEWPSVPVDRWTTLVEGTGE